MPIGLYAQVPQPRRLVMPEHAAFVVAGVQTWRRRRQVDESIALASGLRILMDVVEQCIDHKIPMVSIYLFSQDLQIEDPLAAQQLVPTFLQFLGKAANILTTRDVNLRFFGNRAALTPPLARWLAMAEDRCSGNEGLALNLILDGQCSLTSQCIPEHSISPWITRPARGPGPMDMTARAAPHLSQPDLVLRTGGRLPLHCAMVWDTAESALFFTDTLWPDLGLAEFETALRWFRAERREAGVSANPIH